MGFTSTRKTRSVKTHHFDLRSKVLININAIKQNDPRGVVQLHGGGDGSELEPLYGVDAGVEEY